MENSQRLEERFQVFTQIDKGNLSKEMVQLPSVMFQVGVAKAAAEEKMGRAKAKLKVVKAKVYIAIVKREGAKGKRKPSEKTLEHRVAKHPMVCQAADAYETAKKDFNICWAATNALSAKSQMLSNIAFNYRRELEMKVHDKVKEKRVSEKVSGFKLRRKEVTE